MTNVWEVNCNGGWGWTSCKIPEGAVVTAIETRFDGWGGSTDFDIFVPPRQIVYYSFHQPSFNKKLLLLI